MIYECESSDRKSSRVAPCLVMMVLESIRLAVSWDKMLVYESKPTYEESNMAISPLLNVFPADLNRLYIWLATVRPPVPKHVYRGKAAEDKMRFPLPPPTTSIFALWGICVLTRRKSEGDERELINLTLLNPFDSAIPSRCSVANTSSHCHAPGIRELVERLESAV